MWTKNLQIYKLGLEKAEEPEVKLPISHLVIEKVREYQENIYLCFIDYVKSFDCVDHTNYGKHSERWEYQTILPVAWENCIWVKKQQLKPCIEQLICFRIQKEVKQGYLLSPCLFKLYVEYIMRKARLDELQDGIKIGRRNISNFSYADDTVLMAESEEELKSLLMRVKESETASLKLNI